MTQRNIFIADKTVLKKNGVFYLSSYVWTFIQRWDTLYNILLFLSLPVEIHDPLRPKRLRH